MLSTFYLKYKTDNAELLRKAYISTNMQKHRNEKCEQINLTIRESHIAPKIFKASKAEAKLERQGHTEREIDRARIRYHNQRYNYSHSVSPTIKAAKLT